MGKGETEVVGRPRAQRQVRTDFLPPPAADPHSPPPTRWHPLHSAGRSPRASPRAGLGACDFFPHRRPLHSMRPLLIPTPVPLPPIAFRAY